MSLKFNVQNIHYLKYKAWVNEYVNQHFTYAFSLYKEYYSKEFFGGSLFESDRTDKLI